MTSKANGRFRRSMLIMLGCALAVFLVLQVFSDGYRFGADVARSENAKPGQIGILLLGGVHRLRP